MKKYVLKDGQWYERKALKELAEKGPLAKVRVRRITNTNENIAGEMNCICFDRFA